MAFCLLPGLAAAERYAGEEGYYILSNGKPGAIHVEADESEEDGYYFITYTGDYTGAEKVSSPSTATKDGALQPVFAELPLAKVVISFKDGRMMVEPAPGFKPNPQGATGGDADSILGQYTKLAPPAPGASPEFDAAQAHMEKTWAALQEAAAPGEALEDARIDDGWWRTAHINSFVFKAVITSWYAVGDLPPTALNKDFTLSLEKAYTLVTEDRVKWLEVLIKQARDADYVPGLHGKIYETKPEHWFFKPEGWSLTELPLCEDTELEDLMEQITSAYEKDGGEGVTVTGRLNGSGYLASDRTVTYSK
jgi:hypothetical protein